MSEKEVAAGRIPLHAIKVRLNQEQLHTVRVAAAMNGLRTSEYLRRAGLEAAKSVIAAGIRKMGLT